METVNEITTIPLCIDLDGTLIKTDTIVESALLAIKSNPFLLFVIPFWVLRGKNYFKSKITSISTPNSEILPYNLPFLQFLMEEKAKGRQLILTTATTGNIANDVNNHVNLFDEIIASKENHNNRAENKKNELIKKFGMKGFDYAGNSAPDLKVWKDSREAILVNTGNNVRKRAIRNGNVTKEFKDKKRTIYLLIKELRVHQWLKNVLIFLPFLLAHKFNDFNTYIITVLGFLSFSFTSSFVYIINDMMDLEADRQHSSKKNRPLASGELSIMTAFSVSTILFITGLIISFTFLDKNYIIILISYFIITSCYTFYLKKIYLVDILTLSILYTIRIIAGAVITDVLLSKWLLGFAIFLFLSLAIVKRYTELRNLADDNKVQSKGRGYNTGDINLLLSIGSSCGLISVLVFFLYIYSPEVILLYHRPELLMPIIILILYWIMRIWFLAHRGEMEDDPIVFTAKDKNSYFVALFIILLIIGAMH